MGQPRYRVRLDVTVDVDGDNSDDAIENAELYIANGVNNATGHNQQMTVRNVAELDE